MNLPEPITRKGWDCENEFLDKRVLFMNPRNSNKTWMIDDVQLLSSVDNN